MRVATWNINSLRLRLDRVLEWLGRVQPDVLALQETKVPDTLFPADAIRGAGYYAAFAGEKSYNGVALITKVPLEGVRGEYPLLENAAKRVISGVVKEVRVYSAYFPNGRAVDTMFYDEKLSWIDSLGDLIEAELDKRPVILMGDFNVAPEEIDVHSPRYWSTRVLFSPPEREALQRLAGKGLVDAFRLVNKEAKQYSWWDYRPPMLQRNLGLRIDHCWVAASLSGQVLNAFIDREERAKPVPSDHAPVVVDLYGL